MSQPSHSEPLGLLVTADPGGDAAAQRLEFSSRGDRVPCALRLAGSGPAPVVVLVGDTGSHRCDPAFAFADGLVERGIGVVTLDLTLHGERQSPKFSERLFEALRPGSQPDQNGGALLEEFAAQSKSDLVRLLDVLAARPEVDAKRLGLLGIGIGAHLAALAAAESGGVSALAMFGRAEAPAPALASDAALESLAGCATTESASAPDAALCDWFAQAFERS